MPQARTTIWLYRLPSLLGRDIGAVLLTYWTALAFVVAPHRAAGGADDGELHPARRRGAARQDRRGAAVHLRRGDGRAWRASISRSGTTPETKIGWREPAILWTALAAGVLIKGPLILMFVVLTALTLSIVDRSARWIWSHAPVRRLRLAGGAGAAVVRRHRREVGRQLLRGVGRPRHAGQGVQRPGSARRAARTLPCCCFWVTFWPGSMLAGLAAPRSGRRGASRARAFCWPGWCRRGSCSKWS